MAPGLIQEVIDHEDAAPTQRHIELIGVERTLQRLLLDVAHYVEKTTDHEKIILRFTGGWVRDKLLGVPSHDIDVAINNMTGYQFGLKMKDYLDMPGNSERYGLDGVAATQTQSDQAGNTTKSKMVGGLHKIEANPEKSKHLETVTTRILGLDIDLVNLRKESYTDDSRNPQMEFGTAQEDALRRDATVNAMFYNLNTEQVEDFTGRGYEDMRLQTLRTPLEPYQTFKDDPLRVLRLIRFASRLGWKIEQDTLEAMRHADIKDALRKKISRERVGIELEKALRGPDAHEALRLILDLGLYETIYCDPATENATHFKPDLTHAELVIDVLKRLLIEDDMPLTKITIRDGEDAYLAWTMASLVPYRDAPVPEPAQAGRKAPPPIMTQIAREGIKSTSKLCDLVTATVRNVQDIRQVVDAFYQQSRHQSDVPDADRNVMARDVLGMRIRAWGSQWRTQIIFALLGDIAEQPDYIDAYIRRYTSFLQHLEELDVLEAYQFKPLIDGKALAKAMSTTPGPWMKDALDVVMAWQLRNSGQLDPTAAIEEVQKHGELAFSLAQHFLKLTIRPLFLKSRPATITDNAAHQKPTSARVDLRNDDDTARPWKAAASSNALKFLAWSIEHIDQAGIHKLWPLVIPPVLTLIDDWETKYKRLGCQLLTTVLRKTSPDLLQRTGLRPVFEEALLPSLTNVPPLLDVEEAVLLLPDVYQALIALAETKHAGDAVGDKDAALDNIIRRGIIYGYAHAEQYPAVVTVLLQNLTTLTDKLGVAIVKHLRFIIPMLTEVLTRPTPRLDIAESAAVCMHALIRNAWPRVFMYRGDLLKGITSCWLSLDDTLEGTASQKQVREALRTSVSLLRSAMSDGVVAYDEEVTILVAADARLSPLFEA